MRKVLEDSKIEYEHNQWDAQDVQRVLLHGGDVAIPQLEDPVLEGQSWTWTSTVPSGEIKLPRQCWWVSMCGHHPRHGHQWCPRRRRPPNHGSHRRHHPPTFDSHRPTSASPWTIMKRTAATT